MFEDVKTMIAVRRQEARVLALSSTEKKPHLMAVPGDLTSPFRSICKME